MGNARKCDFCGNLIEDCDQSWTVVPAAGNPTEDDEDLCYDCYHGKLKR
jgi:hypothetical protein